MGYDSDQYTCRGGIVSYFIDDDGILEIKMETAWTEQGGVRMAIEKTFPSIKVYLRETEPGCGLYFTNSFDYFPEHYLL